MQVRRVSKSIALEVFFTSLILFISLRAYILGNGFFDYADQYWNPSYYSMNLVYLSPFSNHEFVGILGFTRTIITWPALMLERIIYNQVLSEKVFILYTFVLFIALSYVFAELLYRYLYEKVRLPDTVLKKELLKTVVVLIIFSNLAIINLNVDGGTWSDGIIMLFIAISFLLTQIDKNILMVILYDAVVVSVSIMLDPDYYLIFILSIFLGFIVSKNIRGFKKIGYPFLLLIMTFPALFYIIIGTVITSTGLSNPLAVRSIFYASANSYLNPITSLLLIGHLWSTFSLAPPSVISFMGKNIMTPYFGDMVILPMNFLTYIWIITLSLYPVLAIISVKLPKTRGITIPFLLLLLLSLLLSQWYRIPIVSAIFLDASKIPLIGPAVGTALSLPSHYMNPEGISEAALISVLFLYAWGKVDIIREFSRRDIYLITVISVSFVSYVFYLILNNKSVDAAILVYLISISTLVAILYYVFQYLRSKHFIVGIVRKIKSSGKAVNGKAIISLVIVFIVVFTGWQAFNGSYFPQRSFNGTPQNALSNPDGPYSPVNIPSYVINQYESLSKNNSYNTVFFAPQMPNSFDGEYMGAYLNYLIDNNYTFALKPFMTYENIRYLITYYDSGTITNALNSSGLCMEYLGPGSYMYSDNATLGNSYKANILLNYTGSDSLYSTIYSYLPELGLIPVISGRGNNTLGFNSMSNSVNIISPLYFRSFSPLNNSVNINEILRQNYNVSLGPVRNNYIGDSWYIADSGNSTLVSVQNGSIEWKPQRDINLTINYGSVGPGYYIVVPIQDYMYAETVAKLSFSYKTSDNFTGNLSAGFTYIYNDSTGLEAAYQRVSSYNGSTDGAWINESVTFALPSKTGWFSPELSFNGTAGKIYLKDVNVSWMSIYDKNYINYISTPFDMGNTDIVSPFNGTYYLMLSGNGTLNNRTIDSNQGWYTFTGRDFDFSGNLTVMRAVFFRDPLINLLGNYTVYNYPYSSMVRLNNGGELIKPNYTLEGQMFFGGSHAGSKMILLDSSLVVYGYISLIVYLLILIALPILYSRRGRKKRGLQYAGR
jgi:hypothetical protein